MSEPYSRVWYAETVCEMIAHGRPRYETEGAFKGVIHGWGHYLARWIWLKDNNLERDP